MSGKRVPGQTVEIDGNESWLVLSESEKQETQEGTLWIHQCGATVEMVSVALSHRVPGMLLAGSGDVKRLDVPYCPNCEMLPSAHGTFYDSGEYHINW